MCVNIWAIVSGQINMILQFYIFIVFLLLPK
jgi:hypothetical protein